MQFSAATVQISDFDFGDNREALYKHPTELMSKNVQYKDWGAFLLPCFANHISYLRFRNDGSIYDCHEMFFEMFANKDFEREGRQQLREFMNHKLSKRDSPSEYLSTLV